MKVNKWIKRGLVFKIENDKMSSKIGKPLPEQDILHKCEVHTETHELKSESLNPKPYSFAYPIHLKTVS